MTHAWPMITILSLFAASHGQSASRPGETALLLRVEKVDGATSEGTLVSCTETDGLTIRMQGGELRVPLEDVLRISPQQASRLGAGDLKRRCIIYFANGGRLYCDPHADAPPRTILATSALDQPVEISFKAIRAIRFLEKGTARSEKEFAERMRSAPPDKDLLILAQDEKITTLPGAMERLTPESLEFTVGSTTRTLPLASAHAVVLGAPTGDPKTGFASCALTTGDILVGSLISADLRRVTISLPHVGLVAAPWPVISSIDLRSGRAVYLSDLKPELVQPRSMLANYFPPEINRGLTGRPIALRGRSFNRGVSLHARTLLTYRLDGQYDRLWADIGVDDSAQGAGSVVFRVRGDGRTLYESPTLRGRDPEMRINVDLRGVRELTLECDDAGDLDVSDHGAWANATLQRAVADMQ